MAVLGRSAYSQSPHEINDSVRFTPVVDGVAIVWDDPPGAYNVYRGSLGIGGPWTYNQACLAYDFGSTSFRDPLNPPPNRLFYYLISRFSAPLESPVGRNSDGIEDPNPYACTAVPPDSDADGFPDVLDNCPSISNPEQLDSNCDGTGDACQCVNVVCTAVDQCHAAGTCEPATGACSNPSQVDGTTCNDGDACTQSDSCNAGGCVGSSAVLCIASCPPGFIQVGGLCQKTYDIGPSLLDNLDTFCDGTGSNRYNNCDYLNYGFHWTDLGGNLAAVTRVDVQLETGINCGGSSSSVTLNGVPSGSFDLVGSCQCSSAHVTVSLSGLPTGAYLKAGLNAISVTPIGSCEGLTKTSTLGNNFARVTVTYSPRGNPCRVGACDPATGACSFSNLPDGTLCSDENACTTGDTCQAGTCAPGIATECRGSDACHTCDPSTGACSIPTVCTALDPCHSVGTCDLSTGTCSYPQAPDGVSCSDNNPCTTGDTCQAGICAPGIATVCTASNQCHLAGTCNPATGACSNPSAPNGTVCNDGNACTQTDSCQSGTCFGANPIVCVASDQCHIAGTCDTSTGACSNPVKADGMTCDDGSVSTPTDVCWSGLCVRCAPSAASPRYVDNGPTVTDRSTCFVWEKKTGTLGGVVNCRTTPCPDAHNVNNGYSWSISGIAADGTVFNDFLVRLNTGAGFAGHNDWRLPTTAGCCGTPTNLPAELESIVETGHLGPTINPIFGPTYDGGYWTSCSYGTPSSGAAYMIVFSNGYPSADLKIYGFRARAMRGGP